MAKEAKINNLTGPIHCACVIHGSAYSWDYVDRLYNMLSRNLSQGIKLHVYTEHDRKVPPHMIKHALKDFSNTGLRKAWWYKIQMFDNAHYSGPLLYFDLDTVIVDNIDWITNNSLQYFWAPRDFKRIWRPQHNGINSSVMWWNTNKFTNVWENFNEQNFNLLQKRFPGDQDYIGDIITDKHRRFLDERLIKSWKWECFDGGWDFRRRRHNTAGSGTVLNGASVLVFHGKPNPHEVVDPVVLRYWK